MALSDLPSNKGLRFDDLVSQMRDARRGDDAGDFQMDWCHIQVIKQAYPCAQQNRHEINIQFVNQVRVQGLL